MWSLWRSEVLEEALLIRFKNRGSGLVLRSTSLDESELPVCQYIFLYIVVGSVVPTKSHA